MKEEFIKSLPAEISNEGKEALYKLWVYFNYDNDKVVNYLINEFKSL